MFALLLELTIILHWFIQRRLEPHKWVPYYQDVTDSEVSETGNGYPCVKGNGRCCMFNK